MPGPHTPGIVGTRLNWSLPKNQIGYVYHYDVILPQWDTGEREFKLGNKKGTELVMRLQLDVRPDLFNPLDLYYALTLLSQHLTGKKNLFSFQAYTNLKSQEFQVPWEAGQSNRLKNVAIRVVFVKQIDISTLERLMKGDPDSLNPESDAATAISMLNLFIQSTPRMTDPRIYNAKSFFTPQNKRTSDKIRPLELWRGHFQSVRATFDRIIVNVDVTVGLRKLRLFLKGVKVDVDLPGHAGKRTKTIKDVVLDVGRVRFEKGGETISIADHFETAHRFKIRGESLGVRLGSDGLFPMSVCRTTQQLYRNRSSPEVVREALDFSPAGPSKRLEAIIAGWQELKYTQSPFLIGAGISVNPEPLQVHGRILPPPRILTTPENGSLNPAELTQWTVVDFAGCDTKVLRMFVEDLGIAMQEREVLPPHNIVRRAGGSKIPTALDEAGREARAQMILVILPESAAPLYREVKRYGDITQGVMTQCVKWSRKLATDAQNKRANQYHNNLILKINAKLGGINCVPTDVAMEFLSKGDTMVIGADVSHPAPGSVLPSVAALVASMDSTLSRYAASIRVQASRTEIIEDLAEMFEIALKTFFKANNKQAAKAFLLSLSLNALISVLPEILEDAYGIDRRKWPHLTFIVVGKRHHFRFFPDRGSEDPKGNGNMHAGFIVDQDIVHPVHHDFYLQSQPGLKGTSRPSHYTVLFDSSKLTVRPVRRLILYALCHCYSRATRSVKIPAPVYFPQLVCRRAKFHFSDAVGDVDAMSVTSDEAQHLDFYKAQFGAINNRLKDTMYFV
ncbi:Piwi domain-containing protein [Lyophyllum atratum]|nr:Piwi domain-containing protein [Lyophyllum atratum]